MKCSVKAARFAHDQISYQLAPLEAALEILIGMPTNTLDVADQSIIQEFALQQMEQLVGLRSDLLSRYERVIDANGDIAKLRQHVANFASFEGEF